MFFALPPAAPKKKLLKEQYELSSTVLGSGTYGKVQLAFDRKNNRKCAIKIVLKYYQQDLQRVYKEVQCRKTRKE